MIKANELRIGNIVKHEANERMVVTEIRADYANLVRVRYIRTDTNLEHHSLISPSDIDPILLEPEILEKAGFVKKDDNRFYGNVRFIHEPSGFELLYNNDLTYFHLRNGAFGNPIFSLHHLQNLYFALTGNELEIKDL